MNWFTRGARPRGSPPPAGLSRRSESSKLHRTTTTTAPGGLAPPERKFTATPDDNHNRPRPVHPAGEKVQKLKRNRQPAPPGFTPGERKFTSYTGRKPQTPPAGSSGRSESSRAKAKPTTRPPGACPRGAKVHKLHRTKTTNAPGRFIRPERKFKSYDRIQVPGVGHDPQRPPRGTPLPRLRTGGGNLGRRTGSNLPGLRRQGLPKAPGLLLGVVFRRPVLPGSGTLRPPGQRINSDQCLIVIARSIATKRSQSPNSIGSLATG